MITVEHLTKCYGDFMAVSDLSFEIDEGHVYGFLGPNGAGKSTTMNIMAGCPVSYTHLDVYKRQELYLLYGTVGAVMFFFQPFIFLLSEALYP